MKKRNLGLVKVNFVMFVICIGFFLCGKFGIPYIYEKYGVVIDLASIKINKSTRSRTTYVKLQLDNENISFYHYTY